MARFILILLQLVFTYACNYIFQQLTKDFLHHDISYNSPRLQSSHDEQPKSSVMTVVEFHSEAGEIQ